MQIQQFLALRSAHGTAGIQQSGHFRPERPLPQAIERFPEFAGQRGAVDIQGLAGEPRQRGAFRGALPGLQKLTGIEVGMLLEEFNGLGQGGGPGRRTLGDLAQMLGLSRESRRFQQNA